jgi:lipopolysaccharide biosynthesis glycosyltransferase
MTWNVTPNNTKWRKQNASKNALEMLTRQNPDALKHRLLDKQWFIDILERDITDKQ